MSAKSPSNLPRPDAIEGVQVGQVIPPERAALEMAKVTFLEFQALVRTNLVQAQARKNRPAQNASPFPAA